MSLENHKWIPRYCSGSNLMKEALFLAQSGPKKVDPTRPPVWPTTTRPTAVTEDNSKRPTAVSEDNTMRPTAATTPEDEPEVPTPSK